MGSNNFVLKIKVCEVKIILIPGSLPLILFSSKLKVINHDQRKLINLSIVTKFDRVVQILTYLVSKLQLTAANKALHNPSVRPYPLGEGDLFREGFLPSRP